MDFGGGCLIAVPKILIILKNVTRKGLGPLAQQYSNKDIPQYVYVRDV